ncbi:response regulator [Anabaena subtropica]|uniref:Response regulator n=1 Tax=Anabaena subtropica FACHB-260 TaxID=2692884 RepID=A0ABR8CNL1_9NOST|nr:response regulator [Anabaena subtropica]MBD2344751.1 response regulator [Anabaena subtropica FACHB-260]
MNNIYVSNQSENVNLADDTEDLDIFPELTILVVDDDDNMRFLITEVFEIYGFKVMAATNALEAFELIEQFHLDLLISDINMPGENGYWLIQKIRKLTSPKKSEIPAIAFTANMEANAHNKALASGFQAYLQKPSKIEQILAEATKLLKGSVKLSFP